MNDWGQQGRFGKIKSIAGSAGHVINISGISESRASAVAGLIAEERGGQTLIVTPSFGRAKRLAEDLSFFVGKKVFLIPDEERAFLRYDAKSHYDLENRLAAMTALAKGESCIVVTPFTGAIKKVAPRELFLEHRLRFRQGEETDLEEVRAKLGFMGYEWAGVVEARGQFSIRGGILDLFPADLEQPCRIEYFDTEVDSIRTFDPVTQRSLQNLKELEVYPAEQIVLTEDLYAKAADRIAKEYDGFSRRLSGEKKEAVLEQKDRLLEWITTGVNRQYMEHYIHYFYEEDTFLWDYLKPGSCVIVDDPDRVTEVLEVRDKEQQEDFKVLLERGQMIGEDYKSFPQKEDFLKIYNERPVFVFTPFQKQIRGVTALERSISMISRQPAVCSGRMDFLATELRRYQKQGFEIRIVCSTEERASNMKSFLETEKLDAGIRIQVADLSAGVEFPEDKLVIFSDGDIFVNAKHGRSRREKRAGKPIKAFTDIHKGDYVVHENHGVGKFLGVEQLGIQGVRKDYLKIKYAGEDFLYIPVEQMDLMQKYVGAEGAVPKVNRLDGGEWKKTKARAKAAIQDLAKDLLALSAARQMEKGYGFQIDTPWQREFEDLFPYEETPDQLRCVREIKRDMEKPVSMDRLLCGDVGYGKTEVAARAIFKCIAEGKQAAILVPTTILANQHYYNFKERFESFPFVVEMLCRFRSEKQQGETIRKLEKGGVDIVIGTHRMLSKDVKFADLGLLVIDEEQRFGVQHKESLKQLRKNVDVLTLSATPIPRTLHMSLVGIRDMSIIEEPPEERYPIQTYVMEQDYAVLKEAIERELDRGGQVYIVYNRVRGIQKVAAKIRELVQEASVAVAHGQMNERQLEDIMVDFVSDRYQVLVATTIIESGIDIPNVNTIVILDSDHFGLSQLYQLRGRVGRSNRMAYAYLMYQKDKVLSEPAEKRLRAIREFTEFGSGFRIAMRDLEIRGAGNLLGTEQHGHMVMIGYELYCKLVEDAVRELSGGTLLPPVEEEASIELSAEAYIPDRYIGDELTKLQMYKQIASIRNDKDREDVIDELMDRFGEIPKETLNLIEVARIKALAERAGVIRVYEEQKKIVLAFAQENILTPSKLATLSQVYGMRLLIHGGVKPTVKIIVKDEDWMKEAFKLLTKILE